MTIWSEIKESFRKGTVLTRLIYVNVGVFVALRLIQVVLMLGGGSPVAVMPLVGWLSVPSAPVELLYNPWSLFTYMFLHFDFLHVLFNVLYLYWFGRLFMDLVGARRMLSVYIMGGLAGAFVYILGFNLLPALYNGSSSSLLLGASASVMAVLFAVASYRPDFTVYLFLVGPVKLKYLALGAFVIDLISIPTLNNTGGHLAHIGGALLGLYYGRKMPSQKSSGTFDRLGDQLESLFKKKSKMKVTHSRPLSDMEYNALKIKRQKDLDRILEKIKSSGYDSLSKEEKKSLFEASQDS
jgi:membrane associated rhomboid family serine protease